jgi:soluble lytic murein transglycosylase-like protein
MKRLIHLISLVSLIGLVSGTIPLWAGEYVVLGNGFKLHADRHEPSGETVRIYSNGGMTEMAASAIAGYEQEELSAPVAQAAPVRTEAVPPPVPPVPAATATPSDLAALAAKKYSLPENFVRSVMKAESGFQPNAVSPKGAIGLMQLMPETARELGVDPWIPQKNAEGGAQYLRDLLARYEGDPNQVLLALAAYNAGPAAVERYHGVPPYRETREYVLRVLKNWERDGNK